MRQIKRIFVHCTASAQSWGVRELQQEFKAKGWKNPGYHYVVLKDGEVKELLPVDKVANGVKGYNATSIHVAYVGGIRQENGKLVPVDNRTEAQKSGLLNILRSLKALNKQARIMGHRDIWGKLPAAWQKACPCFDAEAEYKDI